MNVANAESSAQGQPSPVRWKDVADLVARMSFAQVVVIGLLAGLAVAIGSDLWGLIKAALRALIGW